MRAWPCALLVFSVGCYHIRFVNADRQAPVPAHEAWYNNFSSGSRRSPTRLRWTPSVRVEPL